MLFLIYGLLWAAYVHGSGDRGKQVVSGGGASSPVREVVPVRSRSRSRSHNGAGTSRDVRDTASSSHQVAEPLWYPDQAIPPGYRRWAAVPQGHGRHPPGIMPWCPLMPHGPDQQDHRCIVVRDNIYNYRTGGRMRNSIKFSEWWRASAGGSTDRLDQMALRTHTVRFGEEPTWGPAMPSNSEGIVDLGRLIFTWYPQAHDLVSARLSIQPTALLAHWLERRGAHLLAINISWRLDIRRRNTADYEMVMPVSSSEHPQGFPNFAEAPIDPQTGHPVVVPFGHFTWHILEHEGQQVELDYTVESLRQFATRGQRDSSPRLSPYLVWYMNAWEEPVNRDPERPLLQWRTGPGLPDASAANWRRPPGS